MAEFNCDIRKLADLLKVEDEKSDSEDDLPTTGMSKIGPGDIGRSRMHHVSINNSASGDGTKGNQSVDPDAIWQADEVVNLPTGEEHFDPREQPEYEIKFQQAVSPEDMFLQMSGKTTLTASCENMVITIQMKGETKKTIDLSIRETTLDIRSPLYRLHLPLPHPVDPDKGRAEWDSKTEVLSVQLRMVREYDFINF